MASLTTGFVCQHPYAHRRVYRVEGGDTVAECEVCWSCLAVRSQAGGYWPPSSYLYRDGDVLEADGRVRIRGYFRWLATTPLRDAA